MNRLLQRKTERLLKDRNHNLQLAERFAHNQGLQDKFLHQAVSADTELRRILDTERLTQKPNFYERSYQ